MNKISGFYSLGAGLTNTVPLAAAVTALTPYQLVQTQRHQQPWREAQHAGSRGGLSNLQEAPWSGSGPLTHLSWIPLF